MSEVMTNPYPPPPRFKEMGDVGSGERRESGGAARGTPATLNLEAIFGDCFFTPEGDTVFLSDQPESVRRAIVASAEAVPTNMASKFDNGSFQPVAYAGGIVATNLLDNSLKSTVMGTAQQQPTHLKPMSNPAQQKHHLQYATPAMMDAINAASNNKKRTATGTTSTSRERNMSDQQKVERRERNREHAKRSRIRKKFLLESLQQSVSLLKEENDKLRSSIRTHLGDEEADELLKQQNLSEAAASAAQTTLLSSGGATAADGNNKVLDDPDFSFIKALQTAQQNFVVTDPSLPDNPIVYATQGFLNLTGYSLDQVLGRNCRFLQGPETDPKAVEKIRRSIEEGSDMSVCLLNYRVDGSTFWNQFFIAALRDAGGNITNYVGVQCKVSDQYAANVCKKQDEADSVIAEGRPGEEDEDDDNAD